MTLTGCTISTTVSEGTLPTQPAVQNGTENLRSELPPPRQPSPEENLKQINQIVQALYRAQQDRLDLHDQAPWFIESSSELTRVWLRPRRPALTADSKREHYLVVDIPRDEPMRFQVTRSTELGSGDSQPGNTPRQLGPASTAHLMPSPRIVVLAVSAFADSVFHGSRARNLDWSELKQYDTLFQFSIPFRCDDWHEYIRMSRVDGSFEHVGWCPLAP